MTAWTMKHGCATCEYWTGQRQVNSDPRTVEWSGSGTCTGPSSSERGKQVSGGTYPGGGRCWVCWRCLKESSL